MKKIIFIFIFFVALTSKANSHIKHYENLKYIEMEIFRNDQLIGYNYYFFKRNNDITEITNQIKLQVKLLNVNIFKIEGYGVEKYKGNQLISFESKTLQNDKKKFVNLYYDKDINKHIISGSSYSGEANVENIIGNWWNHKLLQTNSQISPVSGSIKKQLVTFIAKEKINLYGKIYDVEHFKLESKNKDLPKNKKLNFDIWYDKKSSMILKVAYSRMGKWEYKVKNFY